MKRLVLLAAALICMFFLFGCEQKQYATLEEAVRDGVVLGENILIDGTNVSGLGVLEARRVLSDVQAARVARISFTVRAGDNSVDVRAETLGIRFNTDEILARAASLPTKAGLWNKEERTFETSVSLKDGAVEHAAQEAALALGRRPENAQVYFDAASETSFAYLKEQRGIEVDAKDLARLLRESALALEGGAFDVLMRDVPPAYTVMDAENDTQLICEFTTSFKGSTFSKPNRVFNIKKAAGLLDGVMIEAEETFSINAALGPRIEANGWKIATGIRYGAYVQEYGGGVCQVSTTLYNAALMADLEITERMHHSWPLGYVEIGRDATISTGGPDLCFRNTTGARLFLRAFTNEAEKTVTVRLYGRPLADGVTIRITSKKTGTLEDLGTEVTVDPLLKPGEIEIEREARIGVTSETYQEFYAADGTLIGKRRVSQDKYRSIKGIMRIGPAAPTPTPTPSPSPTEPGASPTP